MSTNSTFLKEMGITEWTTRDAAPEPIQAILTAEVSNDQAATETQERHSSGIWWFFGNKPQGDAEVLFQNIIRVLGLTPQECPGKIPRTN